MRRKSARSTPSASGPPRTSPPSRLPKGAIPHVSQRAIALTLASAAIVLAIFAAYGSLCTQDAGFFALDDLDYVFGNPQVQAGLTADSIAWAFTTFHVVNWHPLTWLSLQLDYEIYGLEAGGFHLTNVLLHAASSVLLLLVLERMTRAFWPSFLVAALFALHPLHTESVAWIAERKDVLSALFWMLTMAGYVRYARRPGGGRYALVLGALALGLLAKPMLVTLPFVLLLLDVWPLRRWRLGAAPPSAGATARPAEEFKPASLGWLALEKLPLLLLAVAAALVTLVAQGVGMTPELGAQSLGERVLGAALACVAYLYRTFWPVGLMPMYTRLGPFPVAAGSAALILLIALTVLLLWIGRRRHYVSVGWLWFLGTLVPVSGIVQIGLHSSADRYTYIPHIGLFVLLVWGAAELLGKRLPRAALAAAGGGVLAICLLATFQQALLWKYDLAMWEHAVAIDPDNFAAQDLLGQALRARGRCVQALPHYRRALELEPRLTRAHYHLGQALMELEQWEEAAACFATVLRQAPHMTTASLELGRCLLKLGRMEEALTPLTAAARAFPESAIPRGLLATALLYRGRLAEAESEAAAALRLEPGNVEALLVQGQVQCLKGMAVEAERTFLLALRLAPPGDRRRIAGALGLGWALQSQGRTAEAGNLYRQVLAPFPNWPAERLREAWWLATANEANRRNGKLALFYAQAIQQALPGDAQALDALAAAYAEAGQFDEAAAAARKALALFPSSAPTPAEQKLAAAIAARLRLYEQRLPFREGAAPSPGGS